MPADPRQSLGKWGEDLACGELCRLGYEILERRYRTRYGEIDIVARDGPTTVFVEVKTRGGGSFGAGVEAIPPWRQQRIGRMALDYAARRRLLDTPCRIDVVAVSVAGGGATIEVYRNAFDVGAA
jgi:putative endonuclease